MANFAAVVQNTFDETTGDVNVDLPMASSQPASGGAPAAAGNGGQTIRDIIEKREEELKDLEQLQTINNTEMMDKVIEDIDVQVQAPKAKKPKKKKKKAATSGENGEGQEE
jgi:hypothetical protein